MSTRTTNSQDSGQTADNKVVLVPNPTSGTVAHVDMVSGAPVQLPFNPGETSVFREGNDLTFRLDSGDEVTINGFFVVEDGGSLPLLILPDGTMVASEDAFAGTEMDMVTAAGNTDSSSDSNGMNAYDDGAGLLVAGLDRLGKLGTFHWNRSTEPAIEQQGVELPGGEFDLNGETDFFGVHGGIFEDWKANQHLGDGTESPGQLVFNFRPSGSTVVDAIRVSGFPEGTILYIGDLGGEHRVIIITGPDQVIEFSDKDFKDGVYLKPPLDSDADIHLAVEVDIHAQSSGQYSTIKGQSTIRVDAVADKPELDAGNIGGDSDSSGHLVSEDDMQFEYNKGFNESTAHNSESTHSGGARVTVSVSLAFGDYKDGSEQHYALIETHDNLELNLDSIPPGYTYVGTIVIDGKEYHQFEVDSDYLAAHGGDASFEVEFVTSNGAGESSGKDQNFDLQVGGYAKENASDGELDESNNEAWAITEGEGNVSVDVDVVNSDLDVQVGWASEGNRPDKNQPGGTPDYSSMDNGEGVAEDSTAADGAPIHIGLSGSAEGSNEFITSVELKFDEGRGDLCINGEPVVDGMACTGESGAKYTVTIDADGVITIKVEGEVSSLDELGLTYKPSAAGENQYNDADVNMSFTVTVENGAGAKGQYQGETEIVIDAVADKATNVGGAGVQYADGQTAAKPGDSVELSVKATFPDHDGSEKHTILIRVDGNNGTATHGYGDYIIDDARLAELNGLGGGLNTKGDYLELEIPPLSSFDANNEYHIPELGITIKYNGNGSYTVSGVEVTLPDNPPLNSETGDSNMSFGVIGWSQEKGGEPGSNGNNNEHDTGNNNAFGGGNATVHIATPGGSKDDFTLGGGSGFENDQPHNNRPQDEADHYGPDNNTEEVGGVDLNINWSFTDSKEIVTEIIITVPLDRYGNPVGEIHYGDTVYTADKDGNITIPVNADDQKNGFDSGDLVFVPKGSESGQVNLDVTAIIKDTQTGETKKEPLGAIEVDLDAVANRSGEVSGSVDYGTGNTAISSDDKEITVKIETSFTDNDGSERHYVLVQQKPDWDADYETGYYDLDGDGSKEPYYKVPVPTAPPADFGDDYAGDDFHLSADKWKELCESGTTTTDNGVTITLPTGSDGKPDPSGEWKVEVDATLRPPALGEGQHSLGTGSLSEERDIDHSTENRGDDYSGNNVAMRPGDDITIKVDNTEGIKVEGEFLYEGGKQYEKGEEQNGTVHISPSSPNDSFYGELTVSMDSGHGSFAFEGQLLEPGVPRKVTFTDSNGNEVTGYLTTSEGEGGKTTVTFTPDPADQTYSSIDIDVVLDPADHSDMDIKIDVNGNLQNNNSGQQSQNVGGHGGIVVDAEATAPDVEANVPGQEPSEPGAPAPDKPTLTPGDGSSFTIQLEAAFTDIGDGSESHYFLLEAVPGLSYTFMDANGNSVTITISSGYETVVGDDGKIYYKIPANPGDDGKASLDVVVNATDSYDGTGKENIGYGSMSEDTVLSDDETNYNNNIDFNTGGGIDIDVNRGPGDIDVGNVYENNTPNANTGDETTKEYGKIDLPDDATNVKLKPGEGGSILVKDKDGNFTELEPDADGWVTVPKGDEDNVYFGVNEENHQYSDKDISLGYEFDTPGGHKEGETNVQVDGVAQQGRVDNVTMGDGSHSHVGDGSFNMKVEGSGFVDQDGSSDYYVLVEAKPGWECEAEGAELVVIDGETYYRVPVPDSKINEDGTFEMDIPMKAPTPENGSTGSTELGVGTMVVDKPTDEGEKSMENNVAINVDKENKYPVEQSVEDSNLALATTPGYEDALGDDVRISVTGVGENDVVTEIHFTMDSEQGEFLYDGNPIPEGGYEDGNVVIKVETDGNGNTTISITPREPGSGFSEQDVKDYINDKLTIRPNENHSSKDIHLNWGYDAHDTLSGDSNSYEKDHEVIIDAVAHKPEVSEYEVHYADGAEAAKPGEGVKITANVKFTDVADETNYALVQLTPGWEINGITIYGEDGTSIHYSPDELREMEIVYPDGTGNGGGYYQVPLEKNGVNVGQDANNDGDINIKVEVDTTVPEKGINGDTQGNLGIGGMTEDSYGDKEVTLGNNVASDTTTGDGIHIGVVDTDRIIAQQQGEASEGSGDIHLDIRPDGGQNDSITEIKLTNPDKNSGDFYYDFGDGNGPVPLEYDQNGTVVLPPAGYEGDWKFDSGNLTFKPNEGYGGDLNIGVEVTVKDDNSGDSKEFDGKLVISVTPEASAPTDVAGVATCTDEDASLWTLTLSATYSDVDGSEEHFFTFTIPDGYVIDGDYPGLKWMEGADGKGYWQFPADPANPQPTVDIHLKPESGDTPAWDGETGFDYNAGATENGTTILGRTGEMAPEPEGASAPVDFAAQEHSSAPTGSLSGQLQEETVAAEARVGIGQKPGLAQFQEQAQEEGGFFVPEDSLQVGGMLTGEQESLFLDATGIDTLFGSVEPAFLTSSGGGSDGASVNNDWTSHDMGDATILLESMISDENLAEPVDSLLAGAASVQSSNAVPNTENACTNLMDTLHGDVSGSYITYVSLQDTGSLQFQPGEEAEVVMQAIIRNGIA